MRRPAIMGRVAVLGWFLCSAAMAAGAEPAGSGDDIWGRSALTGERADLAAKGATFEASVTQVGQGVVSGGKSGEWEYGGRGDLVVNLDTQKMDLWPGGFLTVELEGNFNKSVNTKTGALMPVNTNQLFPVPGGDNLNVPRLSFAQFLSHYAGVIVGKLDTMGGDANAFAHGKGDTQFFNLAFSINPVALTVPYSTLGAGLIILPTQDPKQAVLTFLATQASGKASTTGFDDFNSEWIGIGEGRLRTGFFGLTGHQLVGALYSSKKYTSFDQRLGQIVETREFAKKDGTWSVYYNFDQFLYEIDKSAQTGLGLFGRFGASDGQPNLLQYFYSAGLGGKGILPGRAHDRFGIGAYYLDVHNPTFQGPLGTRSFLSDEWGFEAFYNIALTGWLLLTPDIQVIGPSQKTRAINNNPRARESIGTATVLGFRLQTVF